MPSRAARSSLAIWSFVCLSLFISETSGPAGTGLCRSNCESYVLAAGSRVGFVCVNSASERIPRTEHFLELYISGSADEQSGTRDGIEQWCQRHCEDSCTDRSLSWYVRTS